jgi:SH3-like domain-containing protein
MAKAGGSWRLLGSAGLAVVCLVIALGVTWSLFGSRPNAGATILGDHTAAIDPATKVTGPSGLPLPRFVSLKADKVNVRRGPSSDHKVAWMFQRKGLPVEIVAEFGNWRRIRDSDGEEGWVLQNMLTGRRMALVAPWRTGLQIPIYSGKGISGGIVAMLSAGVVGTVESCSDNWCLISAGGYEGYIEQSMIWGVYPGEAVN